MVHQDPMKKQARGGDPSLIDEASVWAWLQTEGSSVSAWWPAKAQKSDVAPPFRPVGPPPAGRPAGVRCATTWVAVRVLNGPDPSLRSWLLGPGMLPHCGERNWSV